MTTGRKAKVPGLREQEWLASQAALGLSGGSTKPPSWLQGDRIALEVWRRLVPQLERLSLLTELDLQTVAMICSEASLYRQAVTAIRKEGPIAEGSVKNKIVSPWVKIKDQALSNFSRLIEQTGISASSRARLKVVAAQDWDDGEEDFSII